MSIYACCVCMHVRLYVCTCVCIYASVRAYMHVRVYVCIGVSMRENVCARMFARICMFM
jgi:hypothetical protein